MTRFLFRSAVALGGVTFALCTFNLIAQDAAPPVATATLPITRITLTNAGIGYFHREGSIDGTARVELRVDEEDINDLILTLIAADTKGTSKQITYDNRAPAEITLKAFRIDLAENPGVGSLLHQVRGEKVEITYDDKGDKPATVTGGILSVQKPQSSVASSADGDKSVVVPPRKDEVEQVNLFSDDGLVSVPLTKIRKVKFVKAELQAEFKQALTALAAARGDGKKAIAVTFQGQGKRDVSIGYVADAPLWKPTYRLSLNAPAGLFGAGVLGNNLGGGGGVAGINGGSIGFGGNAAQFGNLGQQFGIAGAAPPTARLQSFAAVENTTDEDWKNVRMKLVSSRPITFRMDLYDPLFIPRPTIEPDLYASLRPPLYQAPASALGGFAGIGGGQVGLQANPALANGINFNAGNLAQNAGVLGGNGIAANLGAGGGVAGIQGGGLTVNRAQVRNRLTYDELKSRQAVRGTAPAADPVAAAVTNLGEAFEYTIAEPVTLNRFQSALLPVMNEAISAERLSIYNPAILAAYPLKGVRLKNTSKLFLAQGPVTVYDGDAAVGQARISDIKPGETQLISYAIDLDVAMKRDGEQHVNTPLSWKIFEGKLVKVTRQRVTYTTEAVNRGSEMKRLWITHPRSPQWKLIAPEKPAETTPNLYRFELAVAATATAKLAVVEERDDTTTTALETLSSSRIDEVLTSEKVPIAVKAALEKLKVLEVNRFANAASLAAEHAAMKEIVEEQTRQRANLGALPKESDAFKRLVKKFDDQETAIEAHKATIKALEAKKAEQADELKGYLKELKAE